MDFFENGDISLRLTDLSLLDQIYSEKNKWIKLFYHSKIGKILVIDEEIQHVEAWTSLYHETIVHLPCSFVDEIETVLILGGGDFYAAAEVLKYTSIRKIIMIDHDPEIIELMRRHYPHAESVFNNPKFELYIGDAFSLINSLTEKFDLVINDSVDLINHSGLNISIFQKLLELNTNKGVCCDLVYRHLFEKLTVQETVDLLTKTKINRAFSLVAIPEYPGVLHVLCIWGKSNVNQNHKTSINKDHMKWIKTPPSNPCLFFSPKHISYYTYLPPYLKKVVDGIGNI